MRGNVFVYNKKTKTRQKRRPKTAVVRPFLVALKAEFSLHMGCEALRLHTDDIHLNHLKIGPVEAA